MRRSSFVLATAALALGASAPARALTPPAPAPAPAPTATAVDWRLDEAGRDALSLELLAFGSSSCLPGSLAASVVESSRRIQIAVLSTPASPVCTADYGPVALTVRLSAPVRGRAVVGLRRLRHDPFSGRPPAASPLRVPRVTGLAAADAVAVVREHELRATVERVADLRGLPRVIGQTPASGRRVRAHAPVTLFVSR